MIRSYSGEVARVRKEDTWVSLGTWVWGAFDIAAATAALLQLKRNWELWDRS